MTHRLALRVYYEDTDLAGIVYYANYLKFMERGRTELLRENGINQGRLKAETGQVFVVVRVEIDYRRPAMFDDMLVVETVVEAIGGASITVHQRVMRDEAVLVEGRIRLACMGHAGGAERIPAALRARLSGGEAEARR